MQVNLFIPFVVLFCLDRASCGKNIDRAKSWFCHDLLLTVLVAMCRPTQQKAGMAS
jgi:hypothetical protein